MLYKIVPKFNKAEWKDRLDLLEKLQIDSEQLFRFAWQERSIWEKLENLHEDLFERLKKIGENDKFDDYFFALASQLNFNVLTEMFVEIDSIAKEMASNLEIVQQEIKPMSNDWIKISTGLELMPDRAEELWQNLNSLGKGEKEDVVKKWEKVADLYHDFRANFLLVSGALLYDQPENWRGDFEEFKNNIDKLNEIAINNDEEKMLAVFRFFGQSFYEHDPYTIGWAIDFLQGYNLDETTLERSLDTILFIIALHLGFSEFDSLPPDTQDILFEHYVWWAMCFGVRVEDYVKWGLLNEVMLNFYLARLNSYVEKLESTNQVLCFSDKNILTISQFIKRFLGYAGGNDLDGYTQVKFVDEFIKENIISSDLKSKLLQLLHLYLHLREGDLVDYHGMLSDEGVKERKDWRSFLEKDLSDEDVKKIKEYLTALQRPTRFKMEIVAVVQKIHWQEEPYLSRVLVLNNIFEEIYPQWSPLLYFDENASEWKFYKELPNPWEGTFLSAETPE